MGLVQWKLQVKRVDKMLVGGLAILLALLTVAGYALAGPIVFALSAGVGTFLVLLFVLETYRRITRDVGLHMDSVLRQMECMQALYYTLKPRTHLPDTRGWAASPDFLKRLAEIILKEKPERVVEASSGVSTLIAAYCLQKNGAGKVYSFEHESKFADATRTLLAEHGLEEYGVIIHAPLGPVDVEGEACQWYNIERQQPDGSIDLLVVDGPPGHIHKHARYPAVPLLYERFSPHALILVDDGIRPEEQEIVGRWTRRYPDLVAEKLALEQGGFLIRRR